MVSPSGHSVMIAIPDAAAVVSIMHHSPSSIPAGISVPVAAGSSPAGTVLAGLTAPAAPGAPSAPQLVMHISTDASNASQAPDACLPPYQGMQNPGSTDRGHPGCGQQLRCPLCPHGEQCGITTAPAGAPDDSHQRSRGTSPPPGRETRMDAATGDGAYIGSPSRGQ